MADTIIIYGGSGGIGSALARTLHEKGNPLHLVARNDERLKKIADQFGAGFTVGDVTDPDLFTKVTDTVSSPCSGLIYAVGTINLGSIRRFSAEDYLQDFKINSVGAALAVKAALPLMKKSGTGASVVLFSSVAAQQGFTLHASVAMTKGAINGLTLSLAAELAPKIRVNAIAPSLTETPLAEPILKNEKMAEAIAAAHALERLGKPEDIARLASFLISPEAGWITGQIIGVDGGRSSLRVAGA